MTCFDGGKTPEETKGTVTASAGTRASAITSATHRVSEFRWRDLPPNRLLSELTSGRLPKLTWVERATACVKLSGTPGIPPAGQGTRGLGSMAERAPVAHARIDTCTQRARLFLWSMAIRSDMWLISGAFDCDGGARFVRACPDAHR